jgi:hypothetical protein
MEAAQNEDEGGKKEIRSFRYCLPASFGSEDRVIWGEGVLIVDYERWNDGSIMVQ